MAAAATPERPTCWRQGSARLQVKRAPRLLHAWTSFWAPCVAHAYKYSAVCARGQSKDCIVSDKGMERQWYAALWPCVALGVGLPVVGVGEPEGSCGGDAAAAGSSSKLIRSGWLLAAESESEGAAAGCEAGAATSISRTAAAPTTDLSCARPPCTTTLPARACMLCMHAQAAATTGRYRSGRTTVVYEMPRQCPVPQAMSDEALLHSAVPRSRDT